MKDEIIAMILQCIVIFILIFVGFAVVDRIDDDTAFAKGFCLDKEGIYNISNYNIEFMDLSEILNCSNKENPTGIDTAISTT